MSEKSKILIPFNYFGGKYTHVNWILTHLPDTKSFVDVFGGSAVILLNKKPSKIETFNDINDVVINFFEQLRNNTDELLNKIYLTPYSRKEYLNAFKSLHDGSNIERARKFFIICNQSFSGSYSRNSGWKISTNEFRCNISEAVSRYQSKLPNLIKIVDRLKNVQISNYDYSVIFEKFNNKNVLLYCDPPYLHSTRSNHRDYAFEMSTMDHEDFLNNCKNSNSKICISGYDSDLYNDLLKDFNKIQCKTKRNGLLHSEKKEIIWMNYEPSQYNLNLFS